MKVDKSRSQRDAKSTETTPVVVLMGGGVDSTTLVDMYHRRKTIMFGVHYNYGQRALIGERRAVVFISKLYGLKLLKRNLSVPVSVRGDEFIGRNALLILAAAAEFGTKPIRIAFGAHSMSPYYDCSERFIESTQSILDGYFSGTVVIEAPLLGFTKAEIAGYAQKRKVPLNATFSCTRASSKPCGQCPSCLDRRALGV